MPCNTHLAISFLDFEPEVLDLFLHALELLIVAATLARQLLVLFIRLPALLRQHLTLLQRLPVKRTQTPGVISRGASCC